MEPTFNQGVVMGRVQHIHSGHENLIDIGLQLCKKVIIIVGSAQKGGPDEEDERNPFEVEFRMHLIEKIYGAYGDRVIIAPLADTTTENDICYQWGLDFASKINEVADGGIDKVDLMIYGNDEDRKGWFDFDDLRELTNHMNHLVIAHEEDRISATRIRNSLFNHEYAAWAECVNPALWGSFADIRQRLMDTKAYEKRGMKEHGNNI